MMATFGVFGRKRKEAVADIVAKFAARKPRRPQSGYAQFYSAILPPLKWR
jgi:hypothetical protein